MVFRKFTLWYNFTRILCFGFLLCLWHYLHEEKYNGKNICLVKNLALPEGRAGTCPGFWEIISGMTDKNVFLSSEAWLHPRVSGSGWPGRPAMSFRVGLLGDRISVGLEADINQWTVNNQSCLHNRVPVKFLDTKAQVKFPGWWHSVHIATHQLWEGAASPYISRYASFPTDDLNVSFPSHEPQLWA